MTQPCLLPRRVGRLIGARSILQVSHQRDRHHLCIRGQNVWQVGG